MRQRPVVSATSGVSDAKRTLADAPLRQDLAVTGSVNQLGDVQAIGGVNEKIEGFFDICAARGLTGSQGVLIPSANVQHLMLREDVVKACADRQFAVYPIACIEEGVALLTGLEAGERQPDGTFPPGSVNRRVRGPPALVRRHPQELRQGRRPEVRALERS